MSINTILNDKPRIRIAAISDPEPSDLGTGITKTLTLYGDYDALQSEYMVTSTVLEWMQNNGMQRWSIKRTGRAKPLSLEATKKITEDGENPEGVFQVDVVIMDPGL